jgi:hypothetical protein
MNLEIDNADARVSASMHVLARQLSSFMNTKMNLCAVEQMKMIVAEFRTDFKRENGFEFPPLVPFVLPSIGFLVFFRADLDNTTIRNKLLLLLRQLAQRQKFPPAIEVASAVKNAWPHYRPPIEELRRDVKLGRRALQ